MKTICQACAINDSKISPHSVHLCSTFSVHDIIQLSPCSMPSFALCKNSETIIVALNKL